MTASLTIALGTVETTDAITAVRAETKQAWTKLRQPTDSLVLYIKASEIGSVYDPMELSGWMPLHHVEINVVGEGSIQAIHTSLLLAGCKATSERREGDSRVLTVERKATTSTVSKPIASKQVAMKVSDDDDDDLMDEDDLLNDTTLGVPSMTPRTATGDDCAGRKPCDDCTCGRAEREETGAPEPKLTKEDIQKKSSACGNCPKGDAFRCASCPYLGKPAFKAGQEHLVLDLTDDF